MPRQPLIQDDAQREQIAVGTDPTGVGAELLGRREIGRPDEHARIGRPRTGFIRRDGQPEVDDDRTAVGRHDDVRRLQVAMDHPLAMRGRHRDRHLADERGGLAGRAGRIAGKRNPRDVSHHQVVQAGHLTHVEHPRQPRMDQPGGLARLAIEPLLHPGIGRDPRPGDFQCHPDLELQVQGEVDVPHAAAAQPLQEPIAAEIAGKGPILTRKDDRRDQGGRAVAADLLVAHGRHDGRHVVGAVERAGLARWVLPGHRRRGVGAVHGIRSKPRGPVLQGPSRRRLPSQGVS